MFGAFWLILLSPIGVRRQSRWLLFLAGAFLFAPSIALVQLRLQGEISRLLATLVGTEAYRRDILILSIPAVLLSGVIQEAAKLLPIVVYAYVIRKQKLMPRFTLSMGALVGAGYGVVEAQWLINAIFAAGFSFDLVSVYGLVALAGFWERFFTVAFHTASGAVLGWGIARRKWWLFYLVTTVWHALLNYSVILFQVGILSSLQVELIIAVMADILFVYAFLLRWRSLPEAELAKMTPPEVIPPVETITGVPESPVATETIKPSAVSQPEPPEERPAEKPETDSSTGSGTEPLRTEHKNTDEPR